MAIPAALLLPQLWNTQAHFERIPGRRAEALDCVVYAFAARQVINPNWQDRLDELARPEVRAAKPAAVIRSGWMG